MGMQLATGLGRKVKPINGKIYRTAGNESILVLGVKAGKILVEYADGRFMTLNDAEWQGLKPNPSRC